MNKNMIKKHIEELKMIPQNEYHKGLLTGYEMAEKIIDGFSEYDYVLTTLSTMQNGAIYSSRIDYVDGFYNALSRVEVIVSSVKEREGAEG